MAFAMAVYGQAFLTDYTKLPPDTLFLDQDIYKYGMLFERSVAAFWVRQLTEFKNNMRWLQGLGETLPEPWRSHVKFNAQWLPPGEPAEPLSVGPSSLLGIPVQDGSNECCKRCLAQGGGLCKGNTDSSDCQCGFRVEDPPPQLTSRTSTLSV